MVTEETTERQVGLRERALQEARLHLQKQREREAQREADNRRQALETLAFHLKADLGITADPVTMVWHPKHGGYAEPFVQVDGLWFGVDYYHEHGYGTTVFRICSSCHCATPVARASSTAALGTYLLNAGDEADAPILCAYCEDAGELITRKQQASANPAPVVAAPAPPTPTLGEQLVSLIREIVDEQLDFRSEE